jgi:hypothetical protein
MGPLCALAEGAASCCRVLQDQRRQQRRPRVQHGGPVRRRGGEGRTRGRGVQAPRSPASAPTCGCRLSGAPALRPPARCVGIAFQALTGSDVENVGEARARAAERSYGLARPAGVLVAATHGLQSFATRLPARLRRCAAAPLTHPHPQATSSHPPWWRTSWRTTAARAPFRDSLRWACNGAAGAGRSGRAGRGGGLLGF